MSYPKNAFMICLIFLAFATLSYSKSPETEKKTITFMKNSGWCWFEDPRAIIHNGKVVIGGVEGNGKGAAVIGVYDLESKKIMGRTVVNKAFDRDDHNSPVFFTRPDGSLLTFYAKHGRDKLHRYRISDKGNYLKWGEEKTFKHSYATTYMNLYEMKKEDKLYNFYRGFKWNPSFITSTDNGKTWNNPTHFIANEIKGKNRPYARYVGNGTDSVHVAFTDGHPRNYGNSVYYTLFRNGKFYRANGEQIKDLRKDGPLRPNESDKVFQGSRKEGRGNNLSALNSGWTSSIAIDPKGRPHIANTLYISNTDHRYRMAFWNGTKWIDREVAYAGKCLYDRESSYTGLITLDPVDPTYVVISTDVDPSTGKDLGGKHEIYRAKVGPGDNVTTIIWKALTENSKVQNIRPIILNKNGLRVILWQRGTFNTYTSYNLDTVGVIEKL